MLLCDPASSFSPFLPLDSHGAYIQRQGAMPFQMSVPVSFSSLGEIEKGQIVVSFLLLLPFFFFLLFRVNIGV